MKYIAILFILFSGVAYAEGDCEGSKIVMTKDPKGGGKKQTRDFLYNKKTREIVWCGKKGANPMEELELLILA